MTTLADATACIRQQWTEQWAELGNGDMPVLWANEKLDPLPDPATTKIWASVEITTGAKRVAAFGGSQQNRWRQSGEVIIRFFVPTGGGTDLLKATADQAVPVFEGWQPGDLKFFEAAETGGDASEDGGWYELDVIASFFFDRIG